MPASMIPWSLPALSAAEQAGRAAALRAQMSGRRSCRYFSDRPVPRGLIEQVLEIAHSAPSGANRKPWRFVAIDDPRLKREIRQAAEEEERRNYDTRFPPEWLEALEPIGTSAEKPYLERAPWLIVLFRVDFEEIRGQRIKNYFPMESAAIMAGFLVMACHLVGLATLTHTPSPMNFLRDICRRPSNERPFLLMPVGYPAEDCTVPEIPKKPLAQALQWNVEG